MGSNGNNRRYQARRLVAKWEGSLWQNADLFSKMGRFVQTHRTPPAYGHGYDCTKSTFAYILFAFLSLQFSQFLLGTLQLLL